MCFTDPCRTGGSRWVYVHLFHRVVLKARILLESTLIRTLTNASQLILFFFAGYYVLFILNGFNSVFTFYFLYLLKYFSGLLQFKSEAVFPRWTVGWAGRHRRIESVGGMCRINYVLRVCVCVCVCESVVCYNYYLEINLMYTYVLVRAWGWWCGRVW